VRFASLGSGSAGNGLVVEAGATRVLVDCGFPVEGTERRLARIGLAPADITAIVVTHEHGDHADGVLPFARRHGVEVWMTHGTARAIPGARPEARVFDSHSPFAIDGLEVRPFPVPHDAREPAQLVLTDGASRLGVLTDTGSTTRHVEAMLSGCDALVLECNHDPAMLASGPYPGWLKTRIGGALGHLSNNQAAKILGRLDRSRLGWIAAAHLSKVNNTPFLAQLALSVVLDCHAHEIAIADQDHGLAWRAV